MPHHWPLAHQQQQSRMRQMGQLQREMEHVNNRNSAFFCFPRGKRSPAATINTERSASKEYVLNLNKVKLSIQM
jgi:hypothetical protein